MQLSITTTHKPATDLSYLLHKNPDKVQTFDITGGKAYVFYPETTDEKCTATMILNIDTLEMIKNQKKSMSDFALKGYVNDRPFVASSFLSSAISSIYSSALNGNSKEKSEVVNKKIPLEVFISVINVSGGENLIKRFFEPLGYEIKIEKYELNENFKSWGESNYFSLTLKNIITLKELLTHLYILIPVFDNEKHYWVSTKDVDILLKKGEGWLENHPEKEFITKRYFKNIKSLSNLYNKKSIDDIEESQKNVDSEENNENEFEEINQIIKETKIKLDKQRLNYVYEKLIESGMKSIIDMGCGEGKLLKLLITNKQFEKIAGTDVSFNNLLKAKERLNFEEMSQKFKERIELFQSSLTYKDKRFSNYESCAIVEVIEHIDVERLESFEKSIFECSKFKYIILTTPNADYNINYKSLNKQNLRHSDHRFEWTKDEFKSWIDKICEKYKYNAKISGVGEFDEQSGHPTQVVEFSL